MDLGNDNRNSLREPTSEQIKFSIMDLNENGASSTRKTFTAKVVDISPTGMGISIDTDIHKGQIIHFVDNKPKWDLPDKGVIIWSFKFNSGHKAGLEFIL